MDKSQMSECFDVPAGCGYTPWTVTQQSFFIYIKPQSFPSLELFLLRNDHRGPDHRQVQFAFGGHFCNLSLRDQRATCGSLGPTRSTTDLISENFDYYPQTMVETFLIDQLTYLQTWNMPMNHGSHHKYIGFYVRIYCFGSRKHDKTSESFFLPTNVQISWASFWVLRNKEGKLNFTRKLDNLKLRIELWSVSIWSYFS